MRLILLLLLMAFSSMPWLLQGQAISPPKLVCATKSANGDVTLTWQLPVNTCGPFVSYEIYHSNALNGPYNLLATINNQFTDTYLHTGADCNNQSNYYYMRSNFNCPGGVPFSSDTLDCNDPAPPELNYVTVQGAGVGIYWSPSSSPETYAYIIYRDDGGFNPIDTIQGRFNTSYVDLTAQPGQRSERYTVAAMDSCGNTGPFFNEPHQTILLDSTTYDCEIRLRINWTAYINWANDSISEHRLLVSKNGGTLQVDTILPQDLFRYTYTNFIDGDQLCVAIAAVDPSGQWVSQSNAICYTVRIVQPARYIYWRNATVTDSSVQLTYLPDPSGDYVLFEVLRSDDGSNYSAIEVENAPPAIPTVRNYEDVTLQATNGDRYYQVRTTDSCNNTQLSGTVRTMHLTGNSRPNFTNKVEWNAFSITHGMVERYLVYQWDRTTNTGMLLQTLPGTTTGRNLSYVHNIADAQSGDGRFCYRIAAEVQLQYPDGVRDSVLSWSNVECVSQMAIIHVPNAIVPGGKNYFFKPVISFAKPGSYRMLIFNRWGELLFETRDMSEAWEGTYNGQLVQQGVYTYFITVTGANGNVIERTGTVMVIR